MKTRRSKKHPVMGWASRFVDAVWMFYYAHRRAILAAAAAATVAAVLWFIIPYLQGRYTVPKLQDALQRADGEVLLSMCLERERELLQVSPEQIHRLLQDLYRILQVKQVLVDMKGYRRYWVSYKATLVLSQGGTIDLGPDGDIVMVYRGGGYKIFSLSGFLYFLAKRAVVTVHPSLRGEPTPERRALFQQTIRQFLQGYGINGVFNIDLRNYPEVAWRVLHHPDEAEKVIDLNKHVSLTWPEE